MIAVRIALFLFGTTVASSHVLKNGLLCDDGVLHAKIPPFTLPFIQQGTNLFYKPQFMSPGTVIQSPIPFQPLPMRPEQLPIIIEEPSRIPEVSVIDIEDTKPLEIPAPPELLPSSEEHADSEPIIADETEGINKPIYIPSPPELPPFSELSAPLTVVIIPDYIPETPAPEQTPVFIPEAPILEPFYLSGLPVFPEIPADIQPTPEQKPIVIPEPPVLPSITLPEIQYTPDRDVSGIPVEIQPAPELKPIEIPEPPVLPPFTASEIQYIPIAPESPIEINSAPEQKPIEIPAPPVLPPFTSELPTCNDISTEEKPVNIPKGPVLPEVSANSETDQETKLFEIPTAPFLPPFEMPVLPAVVVPVVNEHFEPEAQPELKPFEIPEAPALSPLTMPTLSAVQFPIIPQITVPELKPIELPFRPAFPPLAPEFVEIFPNAESKLKHIPEAPMLPPYSDMQVKFIQLDDIPFPPESSDTEPASEFKLEIPAPPELPPFEMPAIPDLIEEAQKPELIPDGPQLPSIDSPAPIDPAAIEYQPLPNIPEAPQLPPFIMSDIPAVVIEEPAKPIEQQSNPAMPQSIQIVEKNAEPCLDNSPESTFALSGAQLMQPTFWAQNIIIDRVLPNMIYGGDEDHIQAKGAIRYPVMTSPLIVKYAN